MAMCLLRALQKKLLTKDRLTRIGIIQENVCVLCNTQLETLDRLYFDCSYSKYIWALCRLKLGMDQNLHGLLEEARTLQNWFQHKTKITVLARLTLVATVWNIWKERNNRAFNKKGISKTQSFKCIVQDITDLLQGYKWGEDRDENKRQLLKFWEPG